MFKWKHRCFELEYKLECEEAMVVNLLKERNALIAKNAELNASNIRLESELLALRKSQKTFFPPNPLPREPISRR